jgi:hypothetical protein
VVKGTRCDALAPNCSRVGKESACPKHDACRISRRPKFSFLRTTIFHHCAPGKPSFESPYGMNKTIQTRVSESTLVFCAYISNCCLIPLNSNRRDSLLICFFVCRAICLVSGLFGEDTCRVSLYSCFSGRDVIKELPPDLRA